MAEPNPIQRHVERFRFAYGRLADEMIRETRKALREGMGARSAVTAAAEAIGFSDRLTDDIMAVVLAGVVDGGVARVVAPDALRRWWLNKSWRGEALTLSQRTSNLQYIDIIADELAAAMDDAASWQRRARAIDTADRIRGDVAQDIREIADAARRALRDPEQYREYKRLLNRTAARVSTLAQDGVPTARLKKAYAAVLRATDKGSAAAIDAALDRAVRAKARYNAERIARTEGARAYGQGFVIKTQAEERVRVVRWNLSSRHPEFDICDLNARADVYGLGPGVYPKDRLPRYPAHPHCLCNLLKGYKDKYPPGKPPERWVRDLPEREKRLLMGREGAERFAQDRSAWRGAVRQLALDDGPRPEIPREYLEV